MSKCKPGVAPKRVRKRYANGHAKPEPKDEGLAPTLMKRITELLIPTAKDKRCGAVLTLMHMRGILSEAEAEAGMKYAADVGAYERSMGHPSRFTRSPSFDEGFKGASGLDLDALRRMDPEAADKLERRIRARRKMIAQHYDRAQACIPAFPAIAGVIVDEVCCNDREVHSVHHQGLKQILGNLAVACYGLSNLGDRRRGKRPSRKADAALIGSSAVDAMAEWFTRRNASVSFYRLSVPNRVQSPTLTAYGSTSLGHCLSNSIVLKRSGLMSEEIVAQIVTAADAKGWRSQITSPSSCPPAMSDAELVAAVEQLRPRLVVS